MTLKIILPLLALVGQIASQDQDVYDLYRSQENLDELPLLPDEGEDKSALLSLLRPSRPNIRDIFRPRPPPPPPPPPPPNCRCPLGFSMCARNPYDQNEVGCIVYCYKRYYPSLDLNKYRWVCPAYPDPYNPYGSQSVFPLAPQSASPPLSPLSLPLGFPHDEAPVPLPVPEYS